MTKQSAILDRCGYGVDLAARVLAYFTRYLVLPAAGHFNTMVLWVFFAHAHDAFSHSPMLGITSPTKRAGKTRVLEVVGNVVPNPLFASNATAAGIFRAIERESSTVLADELDTFLAGKGELRGILNSGHNRSGAYVLRSDGRYSTWAPKVVAMIGTLPDTLKDRTLNIRTMRKLPWEQVERFRQDDPVAADLRARMATWGNENLDALSLADPSVPSELNDRQADCWWPLFAVADRLGRDWPLRAREAAVLLSAATREDESVEDLLGDFAKLFEEGRIVKLPGATIVKALLALPESRWATIDRGRPLSQLYLAKVLRPFGVVPRQWGEGPKAFRRSVRGYFFTDLQEVFARYVEARPEEAIAPGTPGTPGVPDSEDGPAAGTGSCEHPEDR